VAERLTDVIVLALKSIVTPEAGPHLAALQNLTEDLQFLVQRSCGRAPLLPFSLIASDLSCVEIAKQQETQRWLKVKSESDSSADAELTAVYLFRSFDPTISVELYPEAGTERPDFRVKKDADSWTTVEVTQALQSKEQERVSYILERITGSLSEIDVQFVLEIQFCRAAWA
jgi:hypothetical protein